MNITTKIRKNNRNLFFGIIILISLLFYIQFLPVYKINEDYRQKIDLPNSSENTLLFNSTNAYQHIITQLDFGYRVPGTIPHNSCADWIYNEMNSHSDETLRHLFSIQKSGDPKYNCQNILGKINTEKDNILIFGTHWDSRAVAEKDTINKDQPIPGANDGASGVGVLIELARVLYSVRAQLDVQIWFLFIDAEDQGLSKGLYGINGWNWCEGSWIFASEIDNYYNSETETFDGFILLDMVGGTNLEFIKESRNSYNLYNSIFSEGRSLGYNNIFPKDPKTMTITDDHLAFLELGMPVVDLIIDFAYGDWTYHHTHSDDLTHIDKDSLKATGLTLESFLYTYYTINQPNPWNKGTDPFSTSLYIGIMILVGLIMGFGGIKLIQLKKIKSFRKEGLKEESE